MVEMKRSARAFAAYEYKESTVERRRASEYLDGYESFGWELDDAHEAHTAYTGMPVVESLITLHLRRDRRIINKMELTRLQRQFEACMKEIQMLESSKDVHATICALCTGVVGLALLLCAVFSAIGAKVLTCSAYFWHCRARSSARWHIPSTGACTKSARGRLRRCWMRSARRSARFAKRDSASRTHENAGAYGHP